MPTEASMKGCFAYPVAVLIGLDQHERVVEVTEPPPRIYEVPIPVKWSITEFTDAPAYLNLARRTFRLDPLQRSLDYRWIRVYNEGRSQTPENGYIYFEVTEPDLDREKKP